jgi:hypothetical protein
MIYHNPAEFNPAELTFMLNIAKLQLGINSGPYTLSLCYGAEYGVNKR